MFYQQNLHKFSVPQFYYSTVHCNWRFAVVEAGRPSCDQSDILRSLQGTDSVVVGSAAHHVHLDGVSDVGTERKVPELNLRCSSARPKCRPIWAESKQE